MSRLAILEELDTLIEHIEDYYRKRLDEIDVSEDLGDHIGYVKYERKKADELFEALIHLKQARAELDGRIDAYLRRES
jgi:hypothetical protein